MAAVQRYNVPFTMAWQMRVDPQNVRDQGVAAERQLGKMFMVRRRHALGTHLWANFRRDVARQAGAEPRHLGRRCGARHRLYPLAAGRAGDGDRRDGHACYDPRVPMDNGIAIFRYPGGPLAEVICSFICPAAENTVEVVAEKGAIIQNYGDVPSCNVPRPAGACGQKWYTVDKADWTCSEIASPANHGVRIAGLAAPLAEFVQGKRAAHRHGGGRAHHPAHDAGQLCFDARGAAGGDRRCGDR